MWDLHPIPLPTSGRGGVEGGKDQVSALSNLGKSGSQISHSYDANNIPAHMIPHWHDDSGDTPL